MAVRAALVCSANAFGQCSNVILKHRRSSKTAKPQTKLCVPLEKMDSQLMSHKLDQIMAQMSPDTMTECQL